MRSAELFEQVKSKIEDLKAKYKRKQIEKWRKLYIKRNTDEELEEGYRKILESPEGFYAVWERLEREKKHARDNWVLWNTFVDGVRKPFLTQAGTIYGESKEENLLLEENRNTALILLMGLHKKKTIDMAVNEANDGDFLRWVFSSMYRMEVRRESELGSVRLFDERWDAATAKAIDLLDIDRELELWDLLFTPEMTGEIWDRLETIKRQEMDKCKVCGSVVRKEFDFIDGERKPFALDNGDDDSLRDNRRKAIIALMLVEGKCPRFYIEEYVGYLFKGMTTHG